MKWPVVWRLNLILFLWVLATLAFFARPAKADSFAQLDRTNYHMQDTNRKIEIQQQRTSLTNQTAPNLKNGIEFVRQDGRSYGVDMRLKAPLPNFDEEATYEPKGMQSQIENELQDKQTTDFVVERSWVEIRKELEKDNLKYN